MKRLIFVLGSFAAFAALALPCGAQTPKPAASPTQQAKPLPPQKYEMSVDWDIKAKSSDYFYTISGANSIAKYRSVAALKQSVSSMPPNSTLRWAPGCTRRGSDPLSSQAVFADFKAFCFSKQIKFVYVPSG